MSGCKQSIVIYTDLLQHVQKLSLEEAGAVFIAILNYSSTGEIPELSAAADMCFSFIRAQIDRDSEKWESIREKRALSGKIGGVASGESRKQNKANEANASSVKQNEANEAVTVPVNVPVNVTVPVNTTEKINNKLKKQRKVKIEFIPPTIEEIKAYIAEKGYNVNPKTFYDYFTAGDWVDKNGSPVRSWKQKIITWHSNSDNQKKGDRVEPTEKDYTTSTSAYEVL